MAWRKTIVLGICFNNIQNVLMVYCLIFKKHKKCQVIILYLFLWNYVSLPRALVEINWVDWHKRMCVHIKNSRTHSFMILPIQFCHILVVSFWHISYHVVDYRCCLLLTYISSKIWCIGQISESLAIYNNNTHNCAVVYNELSSLCFIPFSKCCLHITY